jgi:hypothetical protein
LQLQTLAQYFFQYLTKRTQAKGSALLGRRFEAAILELLFNVIRPRTQPKRVRARRMRIKYLDPNDSKSSDGTVIFKSSAVEHIPDAILQIKARKVCSRN